MMELFVEDNVDDDCFEDSFVLDFGMLLFIVSIYYYK